MSERRPSPSALPGEAAGSSTSHHGRPKDIGLRLRDLRKAAGVNQTELAHRLGIGQARMSRIELGTHVPTTDLVSRVLAALNSADDVRQDILDQLAELHVEVSTWRRLHRGGLRKHQDRYGAMEASASEIREWSDGVVPSLLQTSGYITAMCETWDVPGLVDVDGIVAGREQRQEILRDRTKRFAFFMNEAALRCRDIPSEVMAEQLDRILLLAAMRHIAVGIVPRDVMVPASTAFVVLDDRAVLIDLDTTEVIIREPDQVSRYRDIFDRLTARAVTGRALAALVQEIAGTLAEADSP